MYLTWLAKQINTDTLDGRRKMIMFVLVSAKYNGDNGNKDANGINADDNAHDNHYYSNNDIGRICTIWYNIWTAFLMFS